MAAKLSPGYRPQRLPRRDRYPYCAMYVPDAAGKNPYEMPLITWVVNGVDTPFRVIEISVPAPDWVGIIAVSPVAPAACVIVNWRELPVQEKPPKDELLRPSTQSSICFAETTGTLRLNADATIASEPAEAESSVCMFAVKTP